MKPVPEGAKDVTSKGVTSQEQNDFYTSLNKTLQEHPDLDIVIKAWTALPDHVKQTISTLVEVSKKSDVFTGST